MVGRRGPPLEVGGLDEVLVVLEVVVEGGQDGGRGAAVRPLGRVVQLVEELYERRVLHHGVLLQNSDVIIPFVSVVQLVEELYERRVLQRRYLLNQTSDLS